MFTQTAKRLLMAAALSIATIATLPAGVVTFSGATAFETDINGNWNGGITSTGCCQGINVEEGSFTGLQANFLTLPITLNNGNFTFYLESSDWTASFGVTYGGVNLFFDGSATPGISAVTLATYDQTVFNGFSTISAAQNTPNLGDGGVAGSGTLVYAGAGGTATITSLQWVGGSGSNPYATADSLSADGPLTVQRVDITVTDAGSATPEPATFGLVALALSGVALLRRRKSTS